jgi:Zn-dependent protease
LFRVRGIQLAVHGSFFLLLAYVAYEGWRDGGWPAVGLNVAITLVFFGCVVLHEFGHSFTAMAFGVHVRSILLMPIGGMAQFDSIPREPTRELLITLAGPAVNFVIAAGLWLAVGFPDGWHPFGFDAFPDSTRGFLQLLLHWNILMGCFNLLPVFPMDGGRILRALLATRLSYLRATAWASWIGKVLAASMALLSIFLWNQPLAAVLFVFIFFAGEAEYRSVRRQDLEDLQWHARIERGPLPPRLGEEPPMLGP